MIPKHGLLPLNLVGLAVSILTALASNTAVAQSDRDSCNSYCLANFAEAKRGLLSHGTDGEALCTCISKQGKVTGVFVEGVAGWSTGASLRVPMGEPDVAISEEPLPPSSPGAIAPIIPGAGESGPTEVEVDDELSVSPAAEERQPTPPERIQARRAEPEQSAPSEVSGRTVEVHGRSEDSPRAGDEHAAPYAFNIIDRPLTLAQEMFEFSFGVYLNYLTGSGLFFGEEYEDGEMRWGQFAMPLGFSVGLADAIELGLTMRVYFQQPSSSVVAPRLYARVAPIPHLAFEVAATLPDTLYSDQAGFSFGMETKYPVLKEKLALYARVLVDHNVEHDWTQLDLRAGLMWAFVPKFYLAGFFGLHNDWWGEEEVGHAALFVREFPVMPLFVEAGFTSSKQVDIYAEWGTHGDMGDGVAPVRFAQFGVRRRF